MIFLSTVHNTRYYQWLDLILPTAPVYGILFFLQYLRFFLQYLHFPTYWKD